MRKIIPFIITLILLSMSSFAILDSNTDLVNITVNFPVNLDYNSSGGSLHTSVVLVLNASVRWTDPMNITNLTFVFVSGTNETTYLNSTTNGSRTTTTYGDFTVNISISDLAPNSFSVYVMAWNESSVGYSDANTINSSKITYVIDRSNPAITLNYPNTGATVSLKGGGYSTLEYTPTETNLGNCTLYLNNQIVSSSTSGTTSPNVTSGTREKFNYYFNGNNNSISYIVGCEDLAGNFGNSSEFTFNVFTTGSSDPQTVVMGGGGGTPEKSSGSSKADKGGFLSNPWIWGVVLLSAVGYFIYRMNKPKKRRK